MNVAEQLELLGLTETVRRVSEAARSDRVACRDQPRHQMAPDKPARPKDEDVFRLHRRVYCATIKVRSQRQSG